MIGRTLSHYEILSEISRGGMGIVYRAVDVKLDREVALKVLPTELVADSERKRRFTQEAKAAAKLDHPHIGMVFEIDEADGTTFIAMELIRGEQLRDTIAKGTLPLRRALEIATDVAEGLAKAHDEGIVHRDLKPANIMVTEDGHTKIIDFGLAKLVEPLAGEGSDIETLTRGETDPGKIMGTVSYMSPEQARGDKVDHRSDIFSFGIVLYKMLTGKLPFRGPSAPETLSAIINSPTPELELPAHKDMAPELQRVMDKCLSKEPEERFQTVKDVVVDLRAARRQLESGTTRPVPEPHKKKRGGWSVVGATIAALVIVGFVVLRSSPPQEDAAPTADSKPSVAVLFFDNMSQDPSLDWLRVGLADMLSTDLAQSPDIRILTTDRLYQILKDMGWTDEPITSSDFVKEVAERGDVENVLVGSFMKAGDNLRISVRLQEVESGDVLTSEHVEGIEESSIFSMADQLTQRVRAKLEIPQTAEFLPLSELTTSSPTAYRLYIEGLVLSRKELQAEAIALFEKAVETDPDFVEAHRQLSTLHFNLGHDADAEKHANLVLEHGERLTERERFRLEARVNSFRETDYSRAIQAFKKLVEGGSSPNNLSVRYMVLERYDEAINLLEESKPSGGFGGMAPYTNLGACYIAKGEYEKAHTVYKEMLNRFPDNAPSYQYLATLYLFWNKLDDAMGTYEKADAVLPGFPSAQLGRWWVSVLEEDWERAASEASALTESNDDRWHWQGKFNHAILELYKGRTQNALPLLNGAAELFQEPGLLSGWAHSMASHVLFEKKQFNDTLSQARLAQEQGKGNPPEWEGLFFEALAKAKQGRFEEASKAASRLLERTEPIPTQKEKRRHLHLTGELSLIQNQTTSATEKLERAESMLPPRGRHGYNHWSRIGPPPHVPIWYTLASTYLAAGDEDNAGQRFRRIIECGVERVEWPIHYVRSFYFLGKIHENRGEMDKAREYYSRFYEYWKDGDIDRERVEEARKKLAS